MSTIEAEYVALSEAVQQTMWLLREMDQQLISTVIYRGSQQNLCLDFVSLDYQKQISKHIDTRLHCTTDLYESDKIDLKYPTTEI